MKIAVRILCILFKYHHITDLLMNRHWFLVRQLILFKVIVQNYQAYPFFFHNARNLRSNNKLLINPGKSVARI